MTAILVVSDMHINSTVALASPVILNEDGTSGKPSKLQKVIYENWLLMIEKAKKVAQYENLIVVFNGDIGDMRSIYGGYQVHTNNPAKIKLHIKGLIEPLCEIAQAVYFVKGTPAHSGDSSYLEEDIADNFDNHVDCPETGDKSWYFLPLEVDKVKIEIAHSASMGKLPWTRYNAANQLASKTIQNYAMRKEDIPDLVIRGHMHRWADSGDNFPNTRAIYLPCWTAADEYISAVEPGAFSEIGALLVVTDHGKYGIEKLKYEIESKRKWHKPQL